MRLPLIKHLVQFVEENDEDFLNETLETLEYLTDSPAIKDEELDVLGELISNMYGALEVSKSTILRAFSFYEVSMLGSAGPAF